MLIEMFLSSVVLAAVPNAISVREFGALERTPDETEDTTISGFFSEYRSSRP